MTFPEPAAFPEPETFPEPATFPEPVEGRGGRGTVLQNSIRVRFRAPFDKLRELSRDGARVRFRPPELRTPARASSSQPRSLS